MCSIDELVAGDHQVRVIWDAVCQMDLHGFIEPIAAREFTEGRPANDPRVMVGLWLWAALNNVARGRLLARLCERDLTFRWMCGGLSMNYHSLNDFRAVQRARNRQGHLRRALVGAGVHGAEFFSRPDVKLRLKTKGCREAGKKGVAAAKKEIKTMNWIQLWRIWRPGRIGVRT